jgi:hypothetical protein
VRFKQRNVKWLGALVESLYTALPALSIVNFFMIAIAVYEPISAFVSPVLPGFNFSWFVVAIGAMTLIATIVTYVIIVPSLNTFRFNQMNKFDSPVLREIEKLRSELAAIGDNGNVSKGGLKALGGYKHTRGTESPPF